MDIISEKLVDGGKMIEFKLFDCDCLVCIPDKPNEKRHVIWRAEFYSAFDDFDVNMLKRGYYRAYINLKNQFGSPWAVSMMKKFHDYFVSKLSVSPKCTLVGLSRGGLYAANYAAEYPEDISALYLDAPVLSVANWPFGKGRTERYESEVQLALKTYDMSEEELLQSSHHPLCKAEKIAKNGTPIIFVCGDSDTVVDHRDNTEAFMEIFKRHGGVCEYHIKPGCGHHPHGLEDTSPIISFVEKYVL